MNLPKAIELNIESERSLRDHKFSDHADAVKIGNEAIKRLIEARVWSPKFGQPPLPGETIQ